MAKSSAVVNPNLGLYFDRSPIAMGPRMLSAGNNFRIKEGKLSNLNLGWTRFPESDSTLQLNGPVKLVAFVRFRDLSKLVFGTTSDLYQYDESSGEVSYLTPTYVTGTASASGTSVSGTGTAWAANVNAGDEISFGSNAQRDPSATWYEILNVGGNTSITLTTSAGIVANGNYTIRKTFSGDIRNEWSHDLFVFADPSGEDEWWVTNGVDPIMRWNGTDGEVEVMSSLGFTAKHLKVFSNQMIFANLVQGGDFLPTDVINSNAGQPDVVNAGIAGQYRAHGGSDEINSIEKLGDMLVFNSKFTITTAQFVGDDVGYVFRNAITGTGSIATRAVANFGDFLEFVSTDNQYRFDGVTVNEINNHVFRDIIRQQDPVRIGQSYAHFDDENGDLIWVIPSTNDPGSGTAEAAPSRAFVEHYLEDTGLQNDAARHPFSQRDFIFTAMGYYEREDNITWNELTQIWSELNFRWNDQFFFSAYPLNIGGTIDGKLYTINTAQNADGAALTSYVRFGKRALGDGRMRGLIKRVYPFATQFPGVDLTVTTRLSDHAGGAATIVHDTDFDQDLNEGQHFVTPYRRGRFLELQYGTAGPNEPWEIAGYDIDVVSGGVR